MVRRKGERTVGMVEKANPNAVFIVPDDTIRAALYDDVERWHRRKKVPCHWGNTFRENDVHHWTLCFAEAAMADQFAGEFGGRRARLEFKRNHHKRIVFL